MKNPQVDWADLLSAAAANMKQQVGEVAFSLSFWRRMARTALALAGDANRYIERKNHAMRKHRSQDVVRRRRLGWRP